MIRYLIKNNFKLMFRNKWNIVVMIAGPILIIALLSSAFSEMMKSYEGVDKFSVGYRIEKGSRMADYVKVMKEAGKESGITFNEYLQGNPEKVVSNNDLAGFVEFTKDEYILYQSEDYKVEAITLEYFLNRVMSEGVNASLQSESLTKEDDMTLPVEKLDFMPAINANDYYGIVYIVYFSWFGVICAAGVLSNEKKYGIGQKYRVSNLSEIKLYLSKFVPVTMVVTACMGVATMITIWMYDIHWGKVLLSATIVFLMIVAGSAFGLMLYNISRSLVITIIVLFTTVWIFGFVGGTFETYMFSSTADSIKQLSPIYHGNRALVELSCMEKSEYVGSAIIYLLVIIAVCSVIAVVTGSIRKRGKV